MGRHVTAERTAGQAVEHWVAAGLLTPQQATELLADLARQPPPERPKEKAAPWVVEALGYLGGVIILVAVGVLAANFWPDLPIPARLAVLLTTVAAMAAAGAVVPQRLGGAAVRLRSVLWAAATAAAVGTMAYWATDVADVSERWLAMCVTGTGLVVAGVFWALHRYELQQAVFFFFLCAFGGATAFSISTPDPFAPETGPGIWPWLTVWTLGVIWFALGLNRVLPNHELAMALGAIAAVFGGMIMVEEPAGAVLALLTLAALIVGSVILRDFILLVIAALGTLVTLPVVIGMYFPNAISVVIALLVVGAVLIAAAVLIARQRRHHPPAAPS